MRARVLRARSRGGDSGRPARDRPTSFLASFLSLSLPSLHTCYLAMPSRTVLVTGPFPLPVSLSPRSAPSSDSPEIAPFPRCFRLCRLLRASLYLPLDCDRRPRAPKLTRSPTQVIDAFLNAGWAVKGTVRSLAKADHLKDRYPDHADKLSFVQVADLVTGEGLDDAVKGCDVVAHTASASPRPFSSEALTLLS